MKSKILITTAVLLWSLSIVNGQGNFTAEKGTTESWSHIKVTVSNVLGFKTDDRPGWRNNGTGFSANATGSGPVSIKIEIICKGGVSYFDYKGSVSVKGPGGKTLIAESPVISKDGGSKAFSVVWDPAADPGSVSVTANISGGNPEGFIYFVTGTIGIEAKSAAVQRTTVPVKALQETLVTVRSQADDLLHHPLEFLITVTRAGKPLANAPVRFDVEGSHKSLADQFFVADQISSRWRGVVRDKIFGATFGEGLRTGTDGTLSIYFLADFERMKRLGQALPIYITVRAFTPTEDEKDEATGGANAAVRNSAFVRAVHLQLGSINYPESTVPLTKQTVRNKRISRFAWANILDQYQTDAELIRSRITINGVPIKPPADAARYWLPMQHNALVKIDYTVRGPQQKTFGQPYWKPPLASGIALEVEWIDGTSAQFSIHNDDNANNALIAVRIPNSAVSFPGQQTERLVYFGVTQIAEAALEFTVKRLILATVTTPAGAAATDIGWFIYHITDRTDDAAQFLGILSADGVNLGNNGTFVRLKSKVAVYPGQKGTRLYVFEGNPSVFDQNGKAVSALAGQAIDFKVGGIVFQPVSAPPPDSARTLVSLLDQNRYTRNGKSAPQTSPNLPVNVPKTVSETKPEIKAIPPVERVNLALKRPAKQSTISEWSSPIGAGGAVDGIKDGRFGFHTPREENPWWQVDLGEPKTLSEIKIFNRLDYNPERSRTIQILLSNDGENWSRVFVNDGSIFGGNDGRPLIVALRGNTARYVRLQIAETNYFHLDEVEIY